MKPDAPGHSRPRETLKVMYVALRYDYGDPRRGSSFEHANFHHTLMHMNGIRAIPFFFDERLRAAGRNRMNRELLDEVERERPHVCFFFLFTDEIKKETIRSITEKSGAVTVNWFSDDHWRFPSFSRFWGPLFTWVVTTDDASLELYRKIGCSRVHLAQWACNHFLYRPHQGPADLDTTFVGQSHSSRKQVMRRLEKSGIEVQCWGRGWSRGRVDQDTMIRIFGRSRINLNFSESSFRWKIKPVAKVFLKRRADGSIHLNHPGEMTGGARALAGKTRAQIKGRVFEVPGSGGFLLTEWAEGLDRYYRIGEEIAVFSGPADLAEKIRYYLAHEQERERIRKAGYERTLRDHTYERRLNDLFRVMGVTGR